MAFNIETRDGLNRVSQPGGPTLAWHEDSGIRLIHAGGHCFKDMARTGELLPYEDWRLSARERAEDLASRLSIEEIIRDRAAFASAVAEEAAAQRDGRATTR